MDAHPVLGTVARALRECGLEAIMIGNAAAALQGAPVTTIDIDFLIPKTPANVRKLKKVAIALECTIYTPYYPVSGLYRLMRDDRALQVDFMTSAHGIRSFNGLRSRAVRAELFGEVLLLASLGYIESKRAAGRPADHAVLETIEKTRRETETERARGNPRSPAQGK